ncbi:MAG TPA: Ig-like domain-containing protein [Gemmatimonadaceae bacterium]|nr:Ig-like domain-containing protein [Gemmatimonadaceae bacterium]
MRLRTGILLLAAVTAAACSDSNGPSVGPPSALLITAGGTTQLGAFGQTVPIAPTVLVTDAKNQPVPNVTVSFTTTGGTVDAATKTTGSNGAASVAWTLGNTFGQKTLTASVAGLPSVTFTANAIAPDAGVLAFNLADPVGDTLSNDSASAVRGHDLVSLRGDYKRDSIIVTATFNAPVSPVTLGGYLEFDMDDNSSTGIGPLSNFFGATANIGVEYQLEMFDSDGGTMFLYSAASQAPVRVSFSGNSVVIRIPMSLLANDEGNFGIVGIVGTPDRPTDIFPNTGAGLVRRNALFGGSLESSVKNPGEERNHVRLDPAPNSLHVSSRINRGFMWNPERSHH